MLIAEKTLLKVSNIVVLIGISSLILFFIFSSPPEYKIEKTENGDTVYLNGKVLERDSHKLRIKHECISEIVSDDEIETKKDQVKIIGIRESFGSIERVRAVTIE